MLGVSIVLFVVLLAVLFAVAAVTAGFGDLMRPAFQDARPVGMPDGRVRPGDLDDLRFNVVLRGYKMAEVDAVLHRMARELAERDAVLAELRGDTAFHRGVAVPPYEAVQPYDQVQPYDAAPSSEPTATAVLYDPTPAESAPAYESPSYEGGSYESAPSYELTPEPLPYEPPPLALLDAPTELLQPVDDETQGFEVYEAPPLPQEPLSDASFSQEPLHQEPLPESLPVEETSPDHG